jgi:PAS domain S-box-containing protein
MSGNPINWPGDHAELAAQLARQRDRYEQLVRNMSDLLMLIEPDGHVSFCNRQVELPPAGDAYPHAGCSIVDMVIEADRPAVLHALSEVRQRQVPVHELLFRVRDPSGNERVMDGSVTPVIEDGAVVQLQFLGRDITERHRTAEALRQAHSELTLRQAQMQLDLDVAGRVHASLLPAPLSTEDILIDLVHTPLLTVGGDYVYIHSAQPRRPGVAIFDVCGHGVAAALVAGRAHSAVYSIAGRGEGPEEIIRRLNRFIHDSFAEMGIFLTLFGLQIDLDAMQYHYSGAGHPPAILRRANGEMIELASAHLPVGVAENAYVGEPFSTAPAAHGDTLWLYTDGLMEIMRGDEPLGIAGLKDRIAHLPPGPPAPGVAQRHLTLLLEGLSKPEDDVTLVVVAVK